MNQIKVNKETLIDTLRKNRAVHRDTFEKAWEGYTTKYIENVEAMLEHAKNGHKPGSLKLNVGLTPPQDHTDDYDVALSMLEWHEGDEINLSHSEFLQFVNDDWGWKGQFTTSTAQYISPDAEV